MAFYKGASAEGQRAMHLIKKRQQQAEEMEKRKKKLEEETETKGKLLETILPGVHCGLEQTKIET